MSSAKKTVGSGGYSTAAVPSFSRLTIGVTAALVAALGLFYWLNTLGYAGALGETAGNIVYIYGITLSPIAAAIIFFVAAGFGRGASIRTQWMLIGLTVASYAVGDLIWMYLELFRGVDPYPSAADIFYMATYAFFIAAMILAIRSYRAIVDVTMPTIVGSSIGILGIAAVYTTVLAPYVLRSGPEELTALGRFLSSFYPLGDIVLMLGPAVVLALTVSKLGRGRFAWPWWIVVAGVVLFVFTDLAFSYADWAGEGVTALMDLGWVAANCLFAVAALVARDVYRR